MKRVALWAAGLCPLIVLLLIWQAVGSDDAISFPRPSSWWTEGRTLSSTGVLWPALGETLKTFALGMVAATGLGILLGVLLGFMPRVERALTPIMDFFRTLPPPVIVPVLGLVLGITTRAGATIIVLAVIWPILLNTINAVHQMPSTRREVGAVLGIGRLESFFKIALPSLLPGIVVGVRTSLSLALVVTLLVDVIGSGGGIGRLLVILQQSFNASGVWALLFVIGALGYLLNLAVQGAASFLLRHHPPAHS